MRLVEAEQVILQTYDYDSTVSKCPKNNRHSAQWSKCQIVPKSRASDRVNNEQLPTSPVTTPLNRQVWIQNLENDHTKAFSSTVLQTVFTSLLAGECLGTGGNPKLYLIYQTFPGGPNS